MLTNGLWHYLTTEYLYLIEDSIDIFFHIYTIRNKCELIIDRHISVNMFNNDQYTVKSPVLAMHLYCVYSMCCIYSIHNDVTTTTII